MTGAASSAWSRSPNLVEHEVTAERGRKTVSDIMMPMVFTLPDDAPIAKAAALMAYEGVHRIVVVDEKGCVVGVVSTLDISRWLGWCAGYSVGRRGPEHFFRLAHSSPGGTPREKEGKHMERGPPDNRGALRVRR